MSLSWEDATSYSRGDRGKKEPTCWSTEVGKWPNNLKITVLIGHRANPDVWVFHCHQLNMETEPIEAHDAAQAKIMALEAVRTRLELLHMALIDQWPGK